MNPVLGNLEPSDIHPVFFAGGGRDPDLDFPVPGMSDVMPYSSSVWSQLSDKSLAAYRRTWREHLRQVIESFQPDLIHSNHIWLLSSLVKDIAPKLPAVATCHATGLRQMELCPGLKNEVVRGCRRIDRFCVLREDHLRQLAGTLEIPSERITVTGVGYRDELFYPAANSAPRTGELLYIGKYSAAKGLPWLLDAVEKLAIDHPDLRLHVAGSGAGPEADRLLSRMETMAPVVVRHGQLDQAALADLMRRCDICVLPSFYEGVPLVLVEAAACGCRIVSTALPGVIEQIAPHLGDRLDLVPLPRLAGIDQPVSEDLPRFVDDLVVALGGALDKGRQTSPPDLAHFTWDAVFGRVENIWRELI
ncbi:MAG: glycosyltransferase family 4 protein [Candidatus Krumholzibacteria bacterium]|nr:glycosyltransferase family 4 protein [Candidatus Krumholzibacteria bacterium]